MDARRVRIGFDEPAEIVGRASIQGQGREVLHVLQTAHPSRTQCNTVVERRAYRYFRWEPNAGCGAG